MWESLREQGRTRTVSWDPSSPLLQSQAAANAMPPSRSPLCPLCSLHSSSSSSPTPCRCQSPMAAISPVDDCQECVHAHTCDGPECVAVELTAQCTDKCVVVPCTDPHHAPLDSALDPFCEAPCTDENCVTLPDLVRPLFLPFLTPSLNILTPLPLVLLCRVPSPVPGLLSPLHVRPPVDAQPVVLILGSVHRGYICQCKCPSPGIH